MDDLSMLSYLETDKYENVRFYRRLGFAVVAEAQVLAARGEKMTFEMTGGLERTKIGMI